MATFLLLLSSFIGLYSENIVSLLFRIYWFSFLSRYLWFCKCSVDIRKKCILSKVLDLLVYLFNETMIVFKCSIYSLFLPTWISHSKIDVLKKCVFLLEMCFILNVYYSDNKSNMYNMINFIMEHYQEGKFK